MLYQTVGNLVLTKYEDATKYMNHISEKNNLQNYEFQSTCLPAHKANTVTVASDRMKWMNRSLITVLASDASSTESSAL